MKKRRRKLKLRFNKNLKKINPRKIKFPKTNLSLINRLKQLVQFNSIAKQLVVLFLVTILVPVIVTMVISTSTSSSEMVKQAKNQLAEANLKTTDYMTLLLGQIESLQAQFNRDSAVDNFVYATRPNSKVVLGTATKELSNRISSMITTSPYIAGIYLITDTDYLVGYPTIYRQGDLSDIYQQTWFEAIQEEANDPIWIDSHEGLEHSDVNYIISVATYYKTISVEFVTLFDVDEGAFLKELENNHSTNDYQTFVITPMGKVLSSEGVVEDDFFDVIKAEALNTEHYVDSAKYQGESHIFSYTKTENGWIVVNVIPEKEILGSINAMGIKLILLGILFSIIAVLIGVFASIRMTKAMKVVMTSMQKAERGDLTVDVEVTRRDEIRILSDTFKSMLEHIRHLVSTSQQVADEVSVATSHIVTRTKQSTSISGEIQKAIENVADGASEQSKEIDQSVQLVTELAEKINLVVTTIETMSRDSDNVQKMTDKGIQTASNLIEKNNEANAITEEVVSSMNTLNANVQDISKITKILKNISEETKLLSFNASIEAARVGEMGRGFAVVANEVSKLASQSAESTKEIETIIESILLQSKVSVEAVKKSERINSEQYEAVHDSTEAFNDIKETINTFVGKMKEVLDYVEQMNTYKNDVENKMYNISSVAQMTAASTEEVTASVEEQTSSLDEILSDIEELADKADTLTKMLKDFKVN